MKELFLKYKNDIILVAVLIAVAATAFVLLPLFQEEGAYAVISVDGLETARYPLDEDLERLIPITQNGSIIGVSNVFVISNGEVRMTEADCPDQICVHHRPISKVGETIVCLPNKVVISIEGEADGIIS